MYYCQTPKDQLKLLIKDCSDFLVKGRYRVIIASPTFGTGFSIDEGLVHLTFGFFFQYPPNTHDCVQMMARARQPISKKVYVFVEDVKLGTYYDYSLEKKVDTSWLAQIGLEQLNIQQQRMSDVIEDILDAAGKFVVYSPEYLTIPDLDKDPFERKSMIWKQFASIKRSEEQVQTYVGCLILLERLRVVTGNQDLKPIQSCHSQVNNYPFVPGYISSFKARNTIREGHLLANCAEQVLKRRKINGDVDMDTIRVVQHSER